MTTTPRLALTNWAAAQASPWNVENTSRVAFDFWSTGGAIVDRDLSTPPVSPTDGDAYLVKATGTGAWSGHDGDIALYASGWLFYVAKEGMPLYVKDEDVRIVYDGAAWNTLGGGVTSTASTTEQLTGTDNAKAATADSVAALWEQGADVASSGTISLGEGGYFNITGTTTITDIDFGTDKAGRKAWVKFAGVLTLTHNASTLILPTGANITTAAGDTACFVSEGSDVVRCVAYQRASGAALAGASLTAAADTDIWAGTSTSKAATPKAMADAALPQTLTDGATINWDMNSGYNAVVTLGGSRTLATPTNMKKGWTYVLEVIQDGSGSHLMTWPASFNWAAAGTPVLSTAANKVDIVTLYCRDASTPKFRAVFSKDA